MLDTCGREVRALRLSVTEACDLRCLYCMPEAGLPARGASLSDGELLAIVEAAVRCGVNKVRITGGEPLLRSGIAALCGRIARVQGIGTVALTTNGTRLAPLAAALRQAGVRRVNISLDSLNPARYRELTRGGDLNAVLAGLHAALAAGFERVKVNCVLIGGVNDGEIAEFVALTQEQPVEVRFIELMPMGECARWPQERFVSAETVLLRVPALTPCGAEGVAHRYRLPGALGTVGLIRPMSDAFCGDCDRIRVTADGKLKPCLHSGVELDLRGLTGEALWRRIAEGIGEKPSAHALGGAGSETDRGMSQIGG